MKKILLFIILLLSILTIRAQDYEIDEEYKLLAKLSLFSEGLNTNEVEITKNSLIKFLSQKINIAVINQNSFSDFVFISISPKLKKDYNDTTLPIIWSNCEEYIIAINIGSRNVYKLKGFRVNEFFPFLVFLIQNDYPDTKNVREFSKQYQVDGLDFNCLYNSIKIKKATNLCPCVNKTCYSGKGADGSRSN